MQTACEQAAYHYMEPCRSLVPAAATTNTSSYDENFFFGGASAVNCTGPDAGTTLSIQGDLTPSKVELPANGFQCDCVCLSSWPSNLGSVTVLLRATDVATPSSPNYKYLATQCAAPALQQQDQVFVTDCASLQKTGAGNTVRSRTAYTRLARKRSRCTH